MITEPSTDAETVPIPGPTEQPPEPRAVWRVWAALRALVVTLLVLGVVTVLCPGLFGAWSAHAADALPRSIELPWRWQASVTDDPPGLAAVVATADGHAEGMLAALTDPAGDGADTANPVEVVGRNGVYRALYPAAGVWTAGANVQLSPDGRFLALPYLDDPTTARRGPTIVDLTTGRTHVVLATISAQADLQVLAWRPDGGALLLATGSRLVLLDVGTGATTVLGPLPAGDLRVAFAPDGQRLAVAGGGTLRLLDAHGAVQWTVSLPDGYALAGGGAFTPDGTRIALVHALPCETNCAGAPPWAVTYLASRDGATTGGPQLPTIAAAAVRAVGWSQRGLVVVRYLPPPPPQPVQGPDGQLHTPEVTVEDDARPADLYELAPGAQARLLIDAPYAVTDLDVAADLVAAGRFDGEPSMPSLLPVETARVRPIDIVLLVVAVGGLATVIGLVANLAGRLARRVRLPRPRRAGTRS